MAAASWRPLRSVVVDRNSSVGRLLRSTTVLLCACVGGDGGMNFWTVSFVVCGALGGACLAAHDDMRTKKMDSEVFQSYCESESFHAKCWSDQVIAMHSAFYGRMRIGRCVEADLGYLGCSSDVLHMTDRRCSGKQECEIRIPDAEFDTTRPCYKELKIYLEANYSCLPVVVEDHPCSVPSLTSQLHLSPLIASRNGCGTRSHPWVLHADPGQRVNITLLNFSSSPPRTEEPGFSSGGGGGGETSPCIPVGYIFEPGVRRNVSICGTGSDQRRSFVYQSETNTVEVVLGSGLRQGPARNNFLVGFKAVGCSDIRLLQDAWVKRNANEVVVGCHSTRQTWHLLCNGNQWTGVIGNCTQHFLAAQKGARIGLPSPAWTHDALIILVAGVSLTLCVLIVCSGLVIIKRGRSRPLSSKPQINYDNVKTFEETGSAADDGSTHASPSSVNDACWTLPPPRIPAPLPPISHIGCGGGGGGGGKGGGGGGYTHVLPSSSSEIPEVDYTDAVNSSSGYASSSSRMVEQNASVVVTSDGRLIQVEEGGSLRGALFGLDGNFAAQD